MVIAQRSLQRHKPRTLEQHVALRVGDHFLLDPVAALRTCVHQAIGRRALGQPGDLMHSLAFLFGEEFAAIGDDEAQIACAGLIYAWVVDLIEYAMAQGEPDATERRQRRADAVLGTGGPLRRDAGPARSRFRYLCHAILLGKCQRASIRLHLNSGGGTATLIGTSTGAASFRRL